MSRYATYGQFDTQPASAGDEAFLGVNMRLHPKLVPPGYVSEAINARFTDGVAEPRKGYVRLAWINKTQTAVLSESAILEEGGVPGAIMDEGGSAILEE